MAKLTYNIHTAIDLRSTGIFNEFKGYQEVYDFKTSVEMAKQPGIEMGYWYPGDLFMHFYSRRDVTKQEYRDTRRSYRNWMHECQKK